MITQSFYKLYLEQRSEKPQEPTNDIRHTDKDNEPPKVSLRPQPFKKNPNEGIMAQIKANDERMIGRNIPKVVEKRIRYERNNIQKRFANDDKLGDLTSIFKPGAQGLTNNKFLYDRELPLSKNEDLISKLIDSNDRHPINSLMRFHNEKTRAKELHNLDYYDNLRKGKVTDTNKFLRTIAHHTHNHDNKFDNPRKRQEWIEKFFADNIEGKDLTYNDLDELIKKQSFNYDELGFDFNTGESHMGLNHTYTRPQPFDYKYLDEFLNSEDDFLDKKNSNFYNQRMGRRTPLANFLELIDNEDQDEELIDINPSLQTTLDVREGARKYLGNYYEKSGFSNTDDVMQSQLGSGILETVFDDFFDQNKGYLSKLQSGMNNSGASDFNYKLSTLVDNYLRLEPNMEDLPSDEAFKKFDSVLDKLTQGNYTSLLDNYDGYYTSIEENNGGFNGMSPENFFDIENLDDYNNFHSFVIGQPEGNNNFYYESDDRRTHQEIMDDMKNMNLLQKFIESQDEDFNLNEFLGQGGYAEEFDRFQRGFKLMDMMHVWKNVVMPDMKNGDIVRLENEPEGDEDKLTAMKIAAERGFKNLPTSIREVFDDFSGLESIYDDEDYLYGEVRDGKISPPNFQQPPMDEDQWNEMLSEYISETMNDIGHDVTHGKMQPDYDWDEDIYNGYLGDSSALSFARDFYGHNGKEAKDIAVNNFYEYYRQSLLANQLTSSIDDGIVEVMSDKLQDSGEDINDILDDLVGGREDIDGFDEYFTNQIKDTIYSDGGEEFRDKMEHMYQSVTKEGDLRNLIKKLVQIKREGGSFYE